MAQTKPNGAFMRKTANVEVTAWWGVDDLLMAKFEGKWMVTHVPWQSPPRK